MNSAGPRSWLLLAHQLPPKPAYFRVKVWRRLNAIGAVPVKNAVYALPVLDRCREDFEWLLKEIAEGGGEAMLCEAQLIGGLSDGAVQDLFRDAREADYEALANDARALQRALKDRAGDGPNDPDAQVRRLRSRFDQIAAIDFCGADGRESVAGLLADLEAATRRASDAAPPGADPERRVGPVPARGTTWVTRAGVRIDRIASAWLIRRFLDPEARFKFVAPQGYRPLAGEVRFDMYEGEFTHEGDRCTFEVLLNRSPVIDPALTALAQIVHDLDLKDAKFGRPEAAGVAASVAGICAATADDEERLSRGAALFDDLYVFFQTSDG